MSGVVASAGFSAESNGRPALMGWCASTSSGTWPSQPAAARLPPFRQRSSRTNSTGCDRGRPPCRRSALLDADPNLRVLFVEPPFDSLHRLLGRESPSRRRGLRSIRPDGRLLTLQPAKAAPRLLGPFADRSLLRQVRRAASRLGFREPMLWVNDPRSAGLPAATGWPCVYDITDDWLRSSAPSRVLRRLETAERDSFAARERSSCARLSSPPRAGTSDRIS